MTAKEQLKSMLQNRYESEDGDLYSVELMSGMINAEIENFKQVLPNKFLPKEIEELLRFSQGFQFGGFDDVRFNALGHFGFEEAFPVSIPLAGDGFGNFWIQDIDSKGNWNSIYYVCHDPAVIVKHSENLAEFVGHLDEFGLKGTESNLDIIHDKITTQLCTEEEGIMEANNKYYDFEDGRLELPEKYLIADLENAPVQTGFYWGKFGPEAKIIRPSDAPIWVVEKKEKLGFLSRLFGRKK